MDVLAGAHDAAEMERTLRLGSKLIGREQSQPPTLRTDLWVTESLAPMMPKDRQLVAESGLYTTADLDRMHWLGASIFWSAVP
jgi:indole-3-glycerol phosphate synthase